MQIDPSPAPAPPAAEAHPPADTPVRRLFDRVTDEIRKVFVGQDELVLGTLVDSSPAATCSSKACPDWGRRCLSAMGRVLGCRFGRIQFTADLMPSDITGAPIFNMKSQEFEFRPGPVFTQLLLADEINRSPAKTHAALLEIMQEYRVTVEKVSHPIQRPFLVLATQNPIETEGTTICPRRGWIGSCSSLWSITRRARKKPRFSSNTACRLNSTAAWRSFRR